VGGTVLCYLAAAFTNPGHVTSYVLRGDEFGDHPAEGQRAGSSTSGGNSSNPAAAKAARKLKVKQVSTE
jgi:hypothetical protein